MARTTVRFYTEGIDEIVNDLVRLGEDVGPIADYMLAESGKVMKQAWKDMAEWHRLRDTGDMIESIDYDKKPRTLKGVRKIDVYPRGKDRHGVRNVEKAFLLHYGTSKIDATWWVDKAEREAAPRVFETMERIFDQYIEKGKGES